MPARFIGYSDIDRIGVYNETITAIRQIFLEDSLITCKAYMLRTQREIKLYAAHIGHLLKPWVRADQHNTGRFLAKLLNRPVTIYGYIEYANDSSELVETHLSVWLDKATYDQLINYEKHLWFRHAGVHLRSKVSAFEIIQWVECPDKPMIIKPHKGTVRIASYVSFVYRQ